MNKRNFFKGIAGRLKVLTMMSALATMTFLASARSASGPVTRLQVELKNGSKEVFLLADAPEITFKGDQCVIECNSFTTSYDMADIVQAIFLDNTNSVEAPVGEKVTVDLSDPTKAVISGVAPATRINVYNVTGAIVASALADQDGTVELDLNDFQRGNIYIVSVNPENNFKLIKK